MSCLVNSKEINLKAYEIFCDSKGTIAFESFRDLGVVGMQ
jgi:hypothetical protein